MNTQAPGRPRTLRAWVGRVRGVIDPSGEGAAGRAAAYDTGRIFGNVMVAIWLVFLLQPLGVAWGMRGEVRGWAGMGAVVAFAAAYLWHFSSSGSIAFAPEVELSRAKRRAVLPRYGVVLVLAGLSTALVGQSGTTAWVFLAVSGLWTWSFRPAVVVSLVLTGLYQVFELTLPGWQTDNSLPFAMLLAMVACSGGILAARRGRALGRAREENAQLLVEEERNRMARDLHDILGHSLTVITVKAELANRLIDVDHDRAKAEVADLERLSRSALSDVRRAVEGYREISLSGELIRAREALTAAGVDAELPNALDEVPEDLQEVFAWTVREGVTNVVRHSAARKCTIVVDSSSITIRDNGAGAAVGLSGNGLRGLRERAGAVGAALVTRTLEPHGFEVQMLVLSDGPVATRQGTPVTRIGPVPGSQALT
ncbi:sensor histidine kinase [Leekyejoonella antrihumi]|uniref:Sensor histidine kinase n=1 Tax=Leekyejoonella antrihumi TaxID=1660198 RepID=A0A563DUX5_9MICO|nr:sensor histidine kinase [Leekyejoonella antrihumi]TWP34045.1 sensor histidine kinase [Leekyejoonella antrihumi]